MIRLTGTSDTTTTSERLTVHRIPDPREPVPALAWPTVGLFFCSLGLWTTSTVLALAEVWPWTITVALNAVAGFAMFTVTHEAMHSTISTHPSVNKLFGRLSMPFFAPTGSFASFRFIHMQHHLFTNDASRDPDNAISHSSGWTAALRWLTLDLHYWPFYLRQIKSRPRSEVAELGGTITVTTSVVTLAIVGGYGLELLVLWYLPIRLAVGVLGWWFDYLPHHNLPSVPSEDPFKTTRNRIGAERLLSPLMLYQNYHLVHHLHPRIPFHRYIVVWRRNENDYLDRDPALSDVRGRPLTTDEYRRLSQLASHRDP